MEPGQVKEMFEDALAAVFEKRDKASDLSRDTHAEHHQWLAERISKEADRAAFWRNIQTKTLPWAIVALMGWAGTSLWGLLTEWAKGHWK